MVRFGSVGLVAQPNLVLSFFGIYNVENSVFSKSPQKWSIIQQKNRGFSEPPLVAYTRPKNIRDLLIRAKLPSKTRQRRKLPGMKRCKENCSICPYVNSCKSVKSTYTDNIVPLNKEFDCLTQNLVYLVHCKKCNDQYVGETKTPSEKDSANTLDMWTAKTLDKPLEDISIFQDIKSLTCQLQYLKSYIQMILLTEKGGSHTILNFSTLNIEE